MKKNFSQNFKKSVKSDYKKDKKEYSNVNEKEKQKLEFMEKRKIEDEEAEKAFGFDRLDQSSEEKIGFLVNMRTVLFLIKPDNIHRRRGRIRIQWT
jgi:hypothetical protein